jgi:hypothetical protein
MRPQPHGGALRNGGTNKGGPGRMPEVLRMRSRAVYEKWLDWADKVVTSKLDEKPNAISDETMMQIGNTVGRYGFPPSDSVSLDEIRERLARQLEAIGATLPASDAEKVIAAIRPVWAAA